MTTLSIKGRILAGSGSLILRLLSARTAAPHRTAPPRPASPRSTSLRIATHRIVIAVCLGLHAHTGARFLVAGRGAGCGDRVRELLLVGECGGGGPSARRVPRARRRRLSDSGRVSDPQDCSTSMRARAEGCRQVRAYIATMRAEVRSVL